MIKAVLAVGVVTASAVNIVGMPAQAQVRVDAGCNAIFVNSSAQNVTVNCGVVDPQLQRIAEVTSDIGRSNPAKTRELVDLLNQLLLQNTRSFDQLLGNTAALNEKSDKLLQLVQSLAKSPESATEVLSKVSADALSYNRLNGPFSVQIIGAHQGASYYKGNDRINLYTGIIVIMRVGLSTEGVYTVGMLINGGGDIRQWYALNLSGTTCSFSSTGPGVTLPTSTNLSWLLSAARDDKVTSNQLPITMVIRGECANYFAGTPLDISMRLYYRDDSLPTVKNQKEADDQWKSADFRFAGITPERPPK